MKYILSWLLTVIYALSPVSSHAKNIAFQEYKHQVMLSSSFSPRDDFTGLAMGMVSYSQPTTFFRIPARRTIEVGYMTGKSEYEQFIFGGMGEILLGWEKLYFAIGIGAYIKGESTDRINSAFTFGEKVSIGSNFGAFNVEAYYRHFSNGSLTNGNSGQDFVGLAIGYKF